MRKQKKIKTKWISHLSRSFYFACVYQPASHLTCLTFLYWNDMRNRSSFSLPLCVVFFPNVVLWYCISLLFKFLLYFHYPYKCVNVNEWLFSSALVNFIDWFNTAFDIIPEQKCVIHPPTLCTLCVCVSSLQTPYNGSSSSLFHDFMVAFNANINKFMEILNFHTMINEILLDEKSI